MCRCTVDTCLDYSKCLIPNRSVELLVSNFQSLRSKLRDRLVAAEQKHDDTAAAKESTSDNRKKSSATTETRISRRQRSTRVTYKDEKDDDDVMEGDVSKPPPAEQPRRTKKRIVAYRALKKKQLQELCAKDGLSAVGNDKELIARHETFTNLYNSECDSFQPRSHQALLAEVKRREKARKDEATRVQFSGAREHSHCMEKLKERRKQIGEVAMGIGGDGEEAAVAPALTSGNPNFDLEVKTNFDKLIAEAKARQGKKKVKPNSDSSKEKGGQGGESSEEFYSADSDETSVVVDTDTHAPIDHTSDNKVTGADSKAAASNGLSCKSSSIVDGTETMASIELPEKLAVTPTSKRKATTSVQRPARSKQKAIAPLPSLDRNAAKSNDRPRRLSSSGNLIGPWECQACTFVNNRRTWSSASCEMCAAKRTPQPTGEENTPSKPGGEENAVSIDC